MPHLHLRTTSDLVENVDVPDILLALVESFSKMESIDPSSVKAYHTLHTQWTMGAGAKPGFIHLSISLLEGRSPEVLGAIGSGMASLLEGLFAASIESGEAGVTVEIRQMPAATYWK